MACDTISLMLAHDQAAGPTNQRESSLMQSALASRGLLRESAGGSVTAANALNHILSTSVTRLPYRAASRFA